MKRLVIIVAVCLLVLNFAACGKATPKSTMEKWVKSIEDFNSKMMTVKDKEIAKTATKAHIAELQEVLSEISEWSSTLPEEKKGEALMTELGPLVQKIKDKTLITAYLASEANALRFALTDTAFKIDYDTFVSLDKQVKAAFSSVGVTLDKFGEAKALLKKIITVNKDFVNALIAVSDGAGLIAAVNTYIDNSKGLFPKLDKVREKLNIPDWQSSPKELQDLVAQMKDAITNMLAAFALKSQAYTDYPGVSELPNKLTQALQ